MLVLVDNVHQLYTRVACCKFAGHVRWRLTIIFLSFCAFDGFHLEHCRIRSEGKLVGMVSGGDVTF